MCVQDAEQVGEENIDVETRESRSNTWPLHCDFLLTHMENWERGPPLTTSSVGNSSPLESIGEDAVIGDRKQTLMNFVPVLRSGEWSDIGKRDYMEDTHICVEDMAKEFGYKVISEEAVSFYGVFDGHDGDNAAKFVRDYLPEAIVKDADFPLEMEKVVTRSFLETDVAFAKLCSLNSSMSSGTTALTAIIHGRSLLVANAGDCRAVLSRCGVAIEMSKDHKTSCTKEKKRIASLGGLIVDDYLNGELRVTRALGNWHVKGMKKMNERGQGGLLTAEPELKLMTLTKEVEFLIIGSDGIWDVFTSQNAIDFARKRLREHNDVKLCCKEMVEEAIKRESKDNLTVVMVCFHSDPPPPVVVERSRVGRSIFPAGGLQNLRSLIEGLKK